MKNKKIIVNTCAENFYRSEKFLQSSLLQNLPSRENVLTWIQKEKKLSYLLKHIESMIQSDPAHDFEHLLRVARWTSFIMYQESKSEINKNNEVTCAIAAALLHDLVNLPKDHTERSKASEYSASKSYSLFVDSGFSPVEAELMATAIRTHSFSRGEIPSSLLGQALQDSDRLDALGTLGIFRLISISTQIGSKCVDPIDPWAEQRAYNDRSFAVDHFFTKLFKLPDSMNTNTAKKEASRRTKTMLVFLQELGHEIGRDLPKAVSTMITRL